MLSTTIIILKWHTYLRKRQLVQNLPTEPVISHTFFIVYVNSHDATHSGNVSHFERQDDDFLKPHFCKLGWFMQIRLSCVTQKHLQKVCKRATLLILVWNAGVGNTQEAFVQQTEWVHAWKKLWDPQLVAAQFCQNFLPVKREFLSHCLVGNIKHFEVAVVVIRHYVNKILFNWIELNWI